MGLLQRIDSFLEPLWLRKAFAFIVIVVLCVLITLSQVEQEKVQLNIVSFYPVFIRGGNKTSSQNSGQSRNSLPIKKIFLNLRKSWTEPIDFRKCPKFKNCQIIRNYKKTDDCDALVLEHIHLPKTPPHRRKGQIWVFITHEPPTIAGGIYNRPRWRNAFNLTMTFRKDSDVFFPWGRVIPVKHEKQVDFEQIYKEKTGDAAWIVSNCRTASKREVYMQTVRKHIKVDQFGRCNKAQCKSPKSFADPNDQCRNGISKKYKFYMSFENSLCNDYMTEKLYVFYKFRRHIIPVIRGAPNVSHILPKNTYVNARDFPNAEKLGEYLRKLADDKERYIAMLKAKDAFTAQAQNDTFMQALCSVCEKIQDSNLVHSQVDLSDWIKRAGCKAPTDL